MKNKILKLLILIILIVMPFSVFAIDETDMNDKQNEYDRIKEELERQYEDKIINNESINEDIINEYNDIKNNNDTDTSKSDDLNSKLTTFVKGISLMKIYLILIIASIPMIIFIIVELLKYKNVHISHEAKIYLDDKTLKQKKIKDSLVSTDINERKIKDSR